MNSACMFAAGAWAMLAVISFSEREALAGFFKLGVSLALVGAAAFFV